MTAKEAIFQVMGWTEDAIEQPWLKGLEPAGKSKNPGSPKMPLAPKPKATSKEPAPGSTGNPMGELEIHDKTSHKGGYKGGRCKYRAQLKALGYVVEALDKVRGLPPPKDKEIGYGDPNEDDDDETSEGADGNSGESGEKEEPQALESPESVEINGEKIDVISQKGKIVLEELKNVLENPESSEQEKEAAEKTIDAIKKELEKTKQPEQPTEEPEKALEESPEETPEKPEEGTEEGAEESEPPKEEEGELLGPISDEEYEKKKNDESVKELKKDWTEKISRGGKVDASALEKGSVEERVLNEILAEREAAGQKVKEYTDKVEEVNFGPEDAPDTGTESEGESPAAQQEPQRGFFGRNWTPGQKKALTELAARFGRAVNAIKKDADDEQFSMLLNKIQHFSDVKSRWQESDAKASEERKVGREQIKKSIDDEVGKSFNEQVIDEIDMLSANEKIPRSCRRALSRIKETLQNPLATTAEEQKALDKYDTLCMKYKLDDIINGDKDSDVEDYIEDGDENHRKGGATVSDEADKNYKVDISDVPDVQSRNGEVIDQDKIVDKMTQDLAKGLGIGVEAKDIKVRPLLATTEFSFAVPEGTTLSEAESKRIIEALKARFPDKDLHSKDPNKKKLVNYEFDTGSQTFRITVANDKTGIVSQKSLLQSKAFQDALKAGGAPVVIGVDSNGTPIIKDLTEIVHALMVGSTSSGKSSTINNIISSLLSQSPYNIRLGLVDCAGTELTQYDGVKHMTRPVATTPEEAEELLKWYANEMRARLKLLRKAGAKDLASYNKLGAEGKLPPGMPSHMPYLPVIFDEFSDLMDDGEHKKGITSLLNSMAREARKTGIHMFMATQKGTTDFIPSSVSSQAMTRIGLAMPSARNAKDFGTPDAHKIPLNTGGFQIKIGKDLISGGGGYLTDAGYRALTEKFKEAGNAIPRQESPAQPSAAAVIEGLAKNEQQKVGLTKIADRVSKGDTTPFIVRQSMADATKKVLEAQGVDYTEETTPDGKVQITPKPKETAPGETGAGTPAGASETHAAGSEAAGRQETSGGESARSSEANAEGENSLFKNTSDLSNAGMTSNFPIQKDVGEGKLEIPIGTFAANLGYDWQGKPEGITRTDLVKISQEEGSLRTRDSGGLWDQKPYKSIIKLGNGKVAICATQMTKDGFDQAKRSSTLKRVAFVDESTANKYGEQIAQHLLNMPIPEKGSDPSLKENTTVFTPTPGGDTTESTSALGGTGGISAGAGASGGAIVSSEGDSGTAGTEAKEPTPFEQQKSTEQGSLNAKAQKEYGLNHDAFEEAINNAQKTYEQEMSRAKTNKDKLAAYNKYAETIEMEKATVNEWRSRNGLNPISEVNEDGTYKIEASGGAEGQPADASKETKTPEDTPAGEASGEAKAEEAKEESAKQPQKSNRAAYEDRYPQTKEGQMQRLNDEKNAALDNKWDELLEKGIPENLIPLHKEYTKLESAFEEREAAINEKYPEQNAGVGEQVNSQNKDKKATQKPTENPYLDQAEIDKQDNEFSKADLEDGAKRLNDSITEWREARKANDSARAKEAREAFNAALEEDNALRKKLGLPERDETGNLPQPKVTGNESLEEPPKQTAPEPPAEQPNADNPAAQEGEAETPAEPPNADNSAAPDAKGETSAPPSATKKGTKGKAKPAETPANIETPQQTAQIEAEPIEESPAPTPAAEPEAKAEEVEPAETAKESGNGAASPEPAETDEAKIAKQVESDANIKALQKKVDTAKSASAKAKAQKRLDSAKAQLAEALRKAATPESGVIKEPQAQSAQAPTANSSATPPQPAQPEERGKTSGKTQVQEPAPPEVNEEQKAVQEQASETSQTESPAATETAAQNPATQGSKGTSAHHKALAELAKKKRLHLPDIGIKDVSELTDEEAAKIRTLASKYLETYKKALDAKAAQKKRMDELGTKKENSDCLDDAQYNKLATKADNLLEDAQKAYNALGDAQESIKIAHSGASEEQSSESPTPEPKMSKALQKIIQSDEDVKTWEEEVAAAKEKFGENSKEYARVREALEDAEEEAKIRGVADILSHKDTPALAKASEHQDLNRATQLVAAVGNKDFGTLSQMLGSDARMKTKDKIDTPQGEKERLAFEAITGMKLPTLTDEDIGTGKKTEHRLTWLFRNKINKALRNFCGVKPQTKEAATPANKAEPPKKQNQNAQPEVTPEQIKANRERMEAQEKEAAKKAAEAQAKREERMAKVQAGKEKSGRELNAQSAESREKAMQQTDTSKSKGMKTLADLSAPKKVTREAAIALNEKLHSISEEARELSSELSGDKELPKEERKQKEGLMASLTKGLQDLLDKQQLGKGNFTFKADRDDSGNLIGLQITDFKGEKGTMEPVREKHTDYSKMSKDEKIAAATKIIEQSVRGLARTSGAGEHRENAQALINAMQKKDPDALADSLRLANEGARKAFEAITGAKLPNTPKGTQEAIDKFCGITPEKRQQIRKEREAARAEQSEQETKPQAKSEPESQADAQARQKAAEDAFKNATSGKNAVKLWDAKGREKPILSLMKDGWRVSKENGTVIFRHPEGYMYSLKDYQSDFGTKEDFQNFVDGAIAYGDYLDGNAPKPSASSVPSGGKVESSKPQEKKVQQEINFSGVEEDEKEIKEKQDALRKRLEALKKNKKGKKKPPTTDEALEEGEYFWDDSETDESGELVPATDAVTADDAVWCEIFEAALVSLNN